MCRAIFYTELVTKFPIFCVNLQQCRIQDQLRTYICMLAGRVYAHDAT